MGNKRCNKVIYCDPKYIVSDEFTDREITFVHPIKHINREHIRYVPRHVYEEETINEIIDPGEPNECKDCSNKRRRNIWNRW